MRRTALKCQVGPFYWDKWAVKCELFNHLNKNESSTGRDFQEDSGEGGFVGRRLAGLRWTDDTYMTPYQGVKTGSHPAFLLTLGQVGRLGVSGGPFRPSQMV